MDFSEYLKPYINKKTKDYYVALSGGADSLVLLNELKKLKPSQVSAMLSKSSSQSRETLYKRCMDLLNEKLPKK